MLGLEEKSAAFGRALATVIRERREEIGMSLTQLGTTAGLSQQSVSYLERLKRTPSIDTLFRVSQALGLSVSSLVKRAEKRAENSEYPNSHS